LDPINLLVVEDDPLMREFVYQTLSRGQYILETASKGIEAQSKLDERAYHLIILDIKLPDLSGLELLSHIKKLSPAPEVVMMTAYATIEGAVEAMRMGAANYLRKPFSAQELEAAVKNALDLQKLKEENKRLRGQLDLQSGYGMMVGKDKKMQEVYKLIDLVAQSHSTVLIQGETGTGKELVARAIHQISSRREEPFISINCAAVPDNLLESELFGHEKGAFTGAISRRKGKFELADGGTILLDEIGEMSLRLQAKLLRVLQEFEFYRIGGSNPIRVDVRVIATTNQDLKQAIKEGRFREDLFFRLNVVKINLPPLREKRNDIPLLANYFLRKYRELYHKDMSIISREAMEMLLKYDWPGNVRELENQMERAVVLNSTSEVKPNHLNLQYDLHFSERTSFSGMVGLSLREMEKNLLLKTLESEGGNRTRAAQVLGITVRTLRNKLKEYRQEGWKENSDQ
jgi:DNA-binding NtrC family response regulator